jgi:tripartite-type tricarboxylate transporter receptor subunit TctC
MRLLRSLGLATLASIAPTTLASAQQAWPQKPITFIIPFAAGGGTDAFARPLAAQLENQLGTRIVLENRAGAGGTVGASAAAKAAPDGYTLLIGAAHHAIAPALYPKIDYNIETDFAPIGLVASPPQVIVVHPGKVAAKSVQELIAFAKANPGKITFGSAGNGTTHHLAGELFKFMAGLDIVHIPYKGGGQAMTDVLGGNIPLVYTAIAGAISHVKSGKLHAVAVSSAQRSSSLPDVPTFIENGVPDFEINSWVGLLAPAKTPKAVLDKLNTELNAVLADAAVRERLNGMGIAATPGSADKFAQEMQRDLTRYGSVVKSAGIKLE